MRERKSRTVQLPRVAACRADSADAPNARDDDDDIDAARLARSRRGSSRGNSEHFFSLESEEKEREKRVRYFSFCASPLLFDAIHFIEGAHMSHKKFFVLLRP